MTITENQAKEISPKINEKIFLICDQCLWTVTCLNKKYLEELAAIMVAWSSGQSEALISSGIPQIIAMNKGFHFAFIGSAL